MAIHIDTIEIMKAHKGHGHLSKAECNELLNRIISKGVQQDETDLIFLVLDQDKERSGSLTNEQFYNIINVYD